MGERRELLSMTAAAKRLGVSRTTVWRMIAEGELDAEHVQGGRRRYTLVALPVACPDDPPGAPPRSRTARLQEQVERLSAAVQSLSALLAEAERRARAADVPRPRFAVWPHPSSGTTALSRIPAGITARPNPMTHPATEWRPLPSPSREDLLEPLRDLFRERSRPRGWWRRLPVARG
jgi:excisionase family DNA binding protein